MCTVLSVQKKAVGNFPVVQDCWKANIRPSSQEIPSFNGKWTHELKSAYHWGPLRHCNLSFFFIGCQPHRSTSQPCDPQVQILLLWKQQVFILFSDKIILVRLEFLFFAPESSYVSQWRLLFLVYIGSLRGEKWRSSTNCSSKLEEKVCLRVTDLDVDEKVSL